MDRCTACLLSVTAYARRPGEVRRDAPPESAPRSTRARDRRLGDDRGRFALAPRGPSDQSARGSHAPRHCRPRATSAPYHAAWWSPSTAHGATRSQAATCILTRERHLRHGRVGDGAHHAACRSRCTCGGARLDGAARTDPRWATRERRHRRTSSPSSSASTVTVSPSANSPSSSARARRSPISRWMTRLSGRAPKAGS